MNAYLPAKRVPTSKRLFFALWPDPATREALADAARDIGAARPTPRGNLHMTLVFLGTVAPTTEAHLCARADVIFLSSFDLHLDRVGAWRRAGVHWLAPSAPPPILGELVAALRHACDDVGAHYDARPHRPHVTLARKGKDMAVAERINPISRPIVWPVNEFALVQSCATADGVKYVIQRRWPLRQ